MNKYIILCCIALIAFSQHVFAQDLFSAARKNDTTFISKAISSKSNLNIVDDRGYSPLILAVYNNQYAAAKLLLDNGADPNLQDKSGNTALMGATFRALPILVQLLIDYKADVNQRNLNGAHALIFAATFGQEAIAKTLLKEKADKTIQDNRGKTALDHAKMQENQNLIDLLK